MGVLNKCSTLINHQVSTMTELVANKFAFVMENEITPSGLHKIQEFFRTLTIILTRERDILSNWFRDAPKFN
jgi:hypothetical protein